MINLAGHPEAEMYITEELKEAGILAVYGAERIGEVQSKIYGELVTKWGTFRFTRAWYYWIVECHVPLGIAKEMYSSPLMKQDVRVAGHCGCPPPEEWAAEMIVTVENGESKYENVWTGEQIEQLKEIKCLAYLAKNKIRKEPGREYSKFIESYHIDSQEGLDLFVEHVNPQEGDTHDETATDEG